MKLFWSLNLFEYITSLEYLFGKSLILNLVVGVILITKTDFKHSTFLNVPILPINYIISILTY